MLLLSIVIIWKKLSAKATEVLFSPTKKNIEEFCIYGKVIDMKYGLYDWTVTYIQFEDLTIGIKLYRPIYIIQLAQSENYIPIQFMKANNPFLEVKK